MNMLIIKPTFRNRALKRLLIITVALSLIGVFSHIFYYQPQLNSHQELHNQVDILQYQLLSLKLLNNSSNNLQALTINIQQINKKLNSRVDTLRLSKLIHNLSKDHGIKIIRQTNAASEPRGEWKTLKQTLAIEGNYRQLRAFIDGIYQLPTMTIIQEASFQKKSGNNNQLTGSLLLLTFQNGLVSS